MFQNIRGLNSKRHLLEAATEEDKHIHAICLTETFITANQTDLLYLEDYKLASSFCRSEHIKGGVCIMLKNNIRDNVEFIERDDILNMTVEMVFETCAIEFPKLNLILIVLYWPNRYRQPDVFYATLRKLLQLLMIKDKQKHIIIGGDININVLLPNVSDKLLEIMNSHDFAQHVTDPTRITQTTSTCIDLVFNNSRNIELVVSTKEFGFSDHKGIIVKIPNKTKEDKIKWFTYKRNFNENNIQKFKQELSKIDWSQIISLDKNVNYNFNSFHTTFKDMLERIIPKRKIKLKQNRVKTWLTRGLKIACKNKRLLKIFISQTNNTVLNSYYKRYEKILKKTVAESKKNQFKRKIQKSSNVIRTTWQIVKERTNKTKIKPKKNLKLNINDFTTEDPIAIANHFNQFFKSVGKPGIHNNQPLGHPVIDPIKNSIYISPTDPKEIYNIIKKLKNKRSYGFDEIPPILVKQCAEELAIPLSFLINQSFTEGVSRIY
ncbi:endonuclease-reverse transcriptase domain-containing protein [Phthorimaea operculella]|nr:endonuclease-reverse transcriptase domain-containing protein [Phthorimaea operculella]